MTREQELSMIDDLRSAQIQLTSYLTRIAIGQERREIIAGAIPCIFHQYSSPAVQEQDILDALPADMFEDEGPRIIGLLHHLRSITERNIKAFSQSRRRHS